MNGAVVLRTARCDAELINHDDKSYLPCSTEAVKFFKIFVASYLKWQNGFAKKYAVVGIPTSLSEKSAGSNSN